MRGTICENESLTNQRMASACLSDSEISDVSDISFSDSESDESSEEESDSQTSTREPCRYYNSGKCRDGSRCSYLHVCKYAMKGNCRYGSKCKLSHNVSGEAAPGATSSHSNQQTDEEQEPGAVLTDGRFYQWQLNDGCVWMDIENDHIIEAQYSLPHSKSIKIYNTAYGAISIDFNKLRIFGKSLKVRRLDDGKTNWIWYCTLRRKWNKYGEKDAKGNPSPVTSADIETKFQSNPKSSYTFSMGSETLEIRFKDMRQVGKSKKRKVTRRPVYRQKNPGAQVNQATSALQNVSLGTKPKWQFQGDHGGWHDFKHRKGTQSECTVTSEDIERKYQQNPSDSIVFKVKGQAYKLDLGAMTQTNLKTKHVRKIRRLLV